mmetsp:Transcript_84228/g.272248  ORF Transcript_84228/g.272248 Transcript_84228/m.272248 type:complete len:202 (+) Transcript_84228:880-1485(+)
MATILVAAVTKTADLETLAALNSGPPCACRSCHQQLLPQSRMISPACRTSSACAKPVGSPSKASKSTACSFSSARQQAPRPLSPPETTTGRSSRTRSLRPPETTKRKWTMTRRRSPRLPAAPTIRVSLSSGMSSSMLQRGRGQHRPSAARLSCRMRPLRRWRKPLQRGHRWRQQRRQMQARRRRGRPQPTSRGAAAAAAGA